MLVPVVFAVLFSLAAADPDLTYPGKCPEITPVADFNITRYTEGTWYTTYYHGKGKWFEQHHCPEFRSYYDLEHQQVFFYKYYLNESRPYWYNVTKDYLVDYPGSFQSPENIREKNPEWWYQAISRVVLTDYDHYSVLWGCYDLKDEDKHYEYIIFNSRRRYMKPEYYDEAKAYFTEHYPEANFREVYWKDCRAKCPHV